MQAGKIIGKIPGFRSGSRVKAILASVFYLFILSVILSVTTPENSPPTPRPTSSSKTRSTTKPTPTPTITQKPAAGVKGEKTQVDEDENVLVTKVVDGDTIALENGEVVRYIGIDTPESGDCYEDEATNKNRELVEGKEVTLEKDISERDRYDRLLRYVYVCDIFVNEISMREGYAQVLTYPPDVKYQDLFLQAQIEARENSRGLWNKCMIQDITSKTSPTTKPTTYSPPTQQQESQPEQQPVSGSCAGIICSHNAYNCSDFSTHVEAQDAYTCCGGLVRVTMRKNEKSIGQNKKQSTRKLRSYNLLMRNTM